MPVAPCQTCGEPTSRWCGTKPCCWECHVAQYPTHARRGRPGRARPDHGADQFDLRCIRCGATWVGKAYESCDWCEWADEGQRDGQRALLLMEPGFDVDEDEKETLRRAEAWSARLAIGIEAGLVTAHEADQAVIAWMKKASAWKV